MVRIVNKSGIGRTDNRSKVEIQAQNEQKKFLDNFKKKFDLDNLNETLLFSSRYSITRIIYYNEIYKLILNKPGVIMEFGNEYGGVLALLCKLRGIYEPYNYSRKVIGFDTFSGFTKKLTSDEKKLKWKRGDLSVPKNYEKYLEQLLNHQEKFSPVSHKKKFELVKGDATKTLPAYIKKNKETLISLAIFDMDVYAPTKSCLKNLLPRLYKGSVLMFDQLNCPDFPGETLALLEAMNIKNLRLKYFHGQSECSYVVID